MIGQAGICEETVTIQGNDRVLEGVLSYANEGQARFASLIAGPHPFLGGELRNNLVTALSTDLSQAGAVALTFNYGGVGGSQGGPADWAGAMSDFWRRGRCEQERAWVDDSASALSALTHWCGEPMVLVGYSFGCWMVTQCLSNCPARAVILISPNPKQHDFGALDGYDAPLLVIQSDNDFTCTLEEGLAWFEGLGPPKTRQVVPAAEHFFRGYESQVTQVVLAFLAEHTDIDLGEA